MYRMSRPRERDARNVKGLIGVLLLAAVLGAFTPSTARGDRPQPGLSPQAAAKAGQAPPGELLLRVDPAVGALVQRLMITMGGQEEARLEELGVIRLRLREGLSLEKALELYSRLPGVDYAEPNYRLKAEFIPNDPFYAAQRWYYNLTEAPQAWDMERGEPSVIVAVLDSGVDVTHPDLRDHIWRNPGEGVPNGIDEDGNGCVDDVHGCNFVQPEDADPSCGPQPTSPSNQVTDDSGHGTFVAGIIGATGNNGMGVIGGAHGTTLLPVKVLDCTGTGTTADAAAGILYAARMGAQVINLSFGGAEPSRTLLEAVVTATGTYGAVVVAASGNQGTQGVTYPARYPEVIAVGASDRNSPDVRAPFSNWGLEVDVVAPGVDLVSTVPQALCDGRWFCPGGQPYSVASGTSFAAAQVAALAALIRSHSPALTTNEVQFVIRATALSLSDDATPGWAGAGRIRMRRALDTILFRIGASGVTKN
jgi:subtilisin family serine protease